MLSIRSVSAQNNYLVDGLEGKSCRASEGLRLNDLIRVVNSAQHLTVLVAVKDKKTDEAVLCFKDQSLAFKSETKEARRYVASALQQTLCDAKAFLSNESQNTAVIGVEKVIKDQLQDDGGDISPRHLSEILAAVGSSIILPANKALGESLSEREAPRTQTECLIDWIAFLTRERGGVGGEAQSQLLETAQDLWLSGDVSIQSVSSLMREAIDITGHPKSGGFCLKATALEAQLAKAAVLWEQSAVSSKKQDENAYVRFHDNPYGRVFDSTVVACFINNPPPEVKSTSQILGKELAKIFMTYGGEGTLFVAKDTQKRVIEDQRFWGEQKPMLSNFLTAETKEELIASLSALLNHSPVDGIDIILIQYLIVKVCNAMQGWDESSTASEPMAFWMEKASKNYKEVIVPAVNRLKSPGPMLTYAVPTAGTTLAHQPPALHEEWMVSSFRPAIGYRPDFTKISPQTYAALESGLPYVGGVSGSAGVIYHWASYLSEQQNLDIEMRHVVLGALMFLNYDGGHSVNEVLWTAHQLDTALGLKLDLHQQGLPEHFTGSYDHLGRVFEGCTYHPDVKSSIGEAWTKTIQYFQDNSFYSDAKGL
jgi:hypothetical protein